MVAIAALAAVISGLAAGPSLGDERANGWLRQLRTTPLRPSAAVAAKIVVAMSFALPAIALVAPRPAWFGDNEGTALGWAESIRLVGLMWLATTPITAIGALIGLTFGGEAAHGATTLAFVVLWLAGGIFTPPTRCPTPWRPSPGRCPPGAWSRSARAWPPGTPCPPQPWWCWPPGRSVPARWPPWPGGGSSPDDK